MKSTYTTMWWQTALAIWLAIACSSFPEALVTFIMRWQLSFTLKIVQISHPTNSWLYISGKRATQAGVYIFLLMAVVPCHSYVDFNFLAPTLISVFPIYLLVCLFFKADVPSIFMSSFTAHLVHNYAVSMNWPDWCADQQISASLFSLLYLFFTL